jgi:photosystem II stability/assembly factor-like uncharacterized protein
VLCVGQPGAGQEGKAIYTSDSRLVQWNRLISVAMLEPGERHKGGISPYGYPVGVSLSNAGSGLLWESRGTTYLTHDSGRSWKPLVSVTKPEVNFGASADAVSAKDLFLLQSRKLGTQDMSLLSSQDGGVSWHEAHVWRSD